MRSTATLKSPTVFLGGGRITAALIAGLRLAGDHRPIVVYDHHPEKLRALQRKYRVRVACDLNSAIRQAGMLIIAVRPRSVKELLQELMRLTTKNILAVSLAAGIPLKNLRNFAPAFQWVRAMPSPSCRIGHGLTAVALDPQMTGPVRKRVWDLFERVGPVVTVPEKQFDIFTVTYSVSHGYHALAALSKAAQRFGLDEKTALTAAAHAFGAAIFSWSTGEQSLAELLHEAATPGGIAAATMQGMDRAGYGKALRHGLAAGLAQARRNAKR